MSNNNGSKAPRGKKRRHSDADDAAYRASPLPKRQAIEINSVTTQETQHPGSPSSGHSSLSNEESLPSEHAGSGSTSSTTIATDNGSPEQAPALDSTAQPTQNPNIASPELSVEVKGGDLAAMNAMLEAEVLRLQSQLEAQMKQYEEKLSAEKKRSQTLKKENANLRAENFGLEWGRKNLEENLDEHKAKHKKHVAELTKSSKARIVDLETELAKSDKCFRALNGKLSDERLEWAGDITQHAEEKLNLEKKHAEEKAELEKQLDQTRYDDRRHKFERDQLRERAGLDAAGRPKPNHPCAQYCGKKPGDAGLHSQASVDHACENYFIQMLLIHYDPRKEKQQKFLRNATAVFKKQKIALPAYLGGPSETKPPEH